MGRLTASLALACLAVLASALTLAAPAHAAEFTKKALTFDVLTGPSGDVPCSIVADLYTPRGTTAANPAPAILATNGFGGSKNDYAKVAASYAKRGYVFLAYSGLGFGGSGCEIHLDDPDWDGRAGTQIVSFLGGTKAARDGTKIDYVTKDAPGDPRVGMIGPSYGGQIQFSIAGQDPRLDTLVPQITWNDLSYALLPNNTDFARGVTYTTPGVSKIDWPVLFTALGVQQGLAAGVTDPSHLKPPCPNFEERVCTSLVRSGSLGYPDADTLALLRHASVSSYMSNIRIPTFLVQGLSDTLFNMQEAIATYRSLRAQGTPVKMLWRSAGHSGGGLGTRENNNDDLEAAYESRMALEWFDWYLQGTGDPPLLDFTFLRDWALGAGGDAAPAVGQTPNFPASTDRTLYLSGTDKLVDARAGVQPGGARIASVPFAPTSTGNGARDVGANDAPGTFAAYATEPLAEDVDVVGVPKLTVKLDAPTFASSQQSPDPSTKLVVFAKLYDQAPDGSLALPRDQLSVARVGDVTKPVTIELPGISHRFAKGHRMRLVLTTQNVTSRNSNAPGPVTVAVDPASPSTLTIPRLGAQSGPTGSGPNGTTPFTPPAGDGPAQTPGAGRRAGVGRQAATLPSARRCVSRRNFRIRLRRPPAGDRIRSATVRVQGKRVRVSRRARRLRAPIDLRGLPRGTVRVSITVRTARGRTLRSARTYRTCVPKRRARR